MRHRFERVALRESAASRCTCNAQRGDATGREYRQRRYAAHRTRDEECAGVCTEHFVYGARSERGDGRAELVSRENPSEYHRRITLSEEVVGDAYGGRHGGDPVESVEHSEQAETPEA